MSKERNRDRRGFKNRNKLDKGQGSNTIEKPEKNWKMMYFRSNKLARTKQLGFEYSREKLIGRVDLEFIPDEY